MNTTGESAIELVSIVGFPHSGSTVLGDVLASATNATHLGELALLFRLADKPSIASCSCGASVRECEVWAPATKSAVKVSGLDEAELDRLLYGLAARDPWQRPHDSNPAVIAALGAVLASYANTTGRLRLIDSSNWPAFADLLGAACPGSLTSIHLLRDPVSATASRYRRGLTRMAKDFGATRKALMLGADTWRWVDWNRRAVDLRPAATVRFEELCSRPSETLDNLAAAIGWSVTAPLTGSRYEVGREHVFWGSRTARTGPIELRIPQNPLPFGRTARRFVERTTSRDARRYGYNSAS